MPRKTLRQRRNPTDDNSNRVRGLVDEMTGLSNAKDIMAKIRKVLPGTSKTAVGSGALYTFTYNAKTPGLYYDPYPLVLVTGVYNWGFRGYNYHWDEERQYTWNQIIGDVYELQQEELEDMQRLSYADLLENPPK